MQFEEMECAVDDPTGKENGQAMSDFLVLPNGLVWKTSSRVFGGVLNLLANQLRESNSSFANWLRGRENLPSGLMTFDCRHLPPDEIRLLLDAVLSSQPQVLDAESPSAWMPALQRLKHYAIVADDGSERRSGGDFRAPVLFDEHLTVEPYPA